MSDNKYKLGDRIAFTKGEGDNAERIVAPVTYVSKYGGYDVTLPVSDRKVSISYMGSKGYTATKLEPEYIRPTEPGVYLTSEGNYRANVLQLRPNGDWLIMPNVDGGIVRRGNSDVNRFFRPVRLYTLKDAALVLAERYAVKYFFGNKHETAQVLRELAEG